MDREKIMELRDISFEYLPSEMVLKEINLDIYSGEKVVILGANGSGKSSLLKILNGLIFPSKGEYNAFGQLVTEETLNDEQFAQAFRQRIGFIFQNSDAQLFSTNVWEEIAFGPLQMKLSFKEVEDRVNGIIRMLELESLKDRPPYRLSGGEKKKVAIASVLSINPKVLILDEPTNGLDPRSQRWLINLLLKLNNAGKTLITCTHNLDIVEEIADRVIVFNEDHKIVASGSPKDILSNKELLLSVNLIDEHYHRHVHAIDKGMQHEHYHSHE
ncbi:energy-coupling factor ABC transporter ATP-binding protein [Clostridium estertheticum]|uniref:energy-coupling factor ABC transporter ATP-binding protein n=1 Tax=Clostridium estertheticum TaxID=238834 RepID=UPI001CF2BCD3|nr:ABC transporter ATP-binding protein [Clostridium estertheticum]MCB2341366.1 energy-coupling factor ABC transporter ATP-binding protein [Clostridium estertheticum]